MSTFQNPVYVARLPFFAAAAGVYVAGAWRHAQQPSLPSTSPMSGVIGCLVLGAVTLAIGVVFARISRRAVRVRDTRAPRMIMGGPGSGVLARWRLASAEKGRELRALQPRMDSPLLQVMLGAVMVPLALMFATFEQAGIFPLRSIVIGSAASLLAGVMMYVVLHRRLRWDATPVGDPAEVIVAEDALLMGGAFYWLHEPNERMIGARVVQDDAAAGPYLEITLATFGRSGQTLHPIRIPIPADRVDELRGVAAQLMTSVPARWRRVSTPPRQPAITG